LAISDVTYELISGQMLKKTLFRADEAKLSVASAARVFPFDTKPEAFKLTAEATRIKLAYLFDPTPPTCVSCGLGKSHIGGAAFVTQFESSKALTPRSIWLDYAYRSFPSERPMKWNPAQREHNKMRAGPLCGLWA